jgi:hypothetical protein
MSRSASVSLLPPNATSIALSPKWSCWRRNRDWACARAEIRPNLRMLIETPYLVLYRTDPDTDDGIVRVVEIIRIVDGRRDLGKIFR